MTWMEEIRSTSPHLPAGSVLGPTVTKSFCGAVAEVTSFLNHTQDSPWVLIAVPIAFLLLIAFIAWRTRWRPIDLGNLRRGRAFGQLLLASVGLYWRHWRVFVPIGLTAIPIIGGFTALTQLLTGDRGRQLDDKIGHSGLHTALGEIISGVGGPIASAIIAAVVIVAVRQISETGEAGFVESYRGMWQRFRRVVGAQLLATLGVFVMLITVVGIPFAAWKYVGWLFLQQQILFEDRPLREAFRGSSELVRGRWWYTLRVAGGLLADRRRHRPGARLRSDLRRPLADPDQRDRRARLRPARPLHRDRPHAALLRPRRRKPKTAPAKKRWRERLPRRAGPAEAQAPAR